MSTDPRQQLRDLVAERVSAVRAKDPRPLAARQAPGIVLFNAVPPFSQRGTGEVAAQTQAWFDGYAGDIGYEVTDLQADAEGDLGFCSFAFHVQGTLAAGGDVDMWVRATLCCRRIDGTWLIVHDHESVPFDAATGQAVMSPEPGRPAHPATRRTRDDQPEDMEGR